jgi:uncharacterized protein YjbI with pentapeptide repeats
MAARLRRPSEPPSAIDLPELAPFTVGGLEAGSDYEGLAFDDLDLGGQPGIGASFRQCRLARCGLDAVGMARTSWSSCLLVDAHGATVDVADSTWREVIVRDARIGALSGPGASLTHVRIRGGKIDYLVLAGSRLRDVAIEDCVVGELDLAGAEVRNLTIEGGVVDVLDVNAARLAGLDLRRTRLGAVRGVGSLRGAVMTPGQLIDLAPMLAEQIGIRIEPEPGG